jgi:hypothetical protein
VMFACASSTNISIRHRMLLVNTFFKFFSKFFSVRKYGTIVNIDIDVRGERINGKTRYPQFAMVPWAYEESPAAD